MPGGLLSAPCAEGPRPSTGSRPRKEGRGRRGAGSAPASGRAPELGPLCQTPTSRLPFVTRLAVSGRHGLLSLGRTGSPVPACPSPAPCVSSTCRLGAPEWPSTVSVSLSVSLSLTYLSRSRYRYLYCNRYIPQPICCCQQDWQPLARAESIAL